MSHPATHRCRIDEERWKAEQRRWMAVVTEDEKRAAYRTLEDRLVRGDGSASSEQRACAFTNSGLGPPLDELVGKVATRPTEVTDADFAAARAADCSEDELFELVICAAVGQSARMYDAGLAALGDAIDGWEDGNAP
jgi:hypothetical protein